MTREQLWIIAYDSPSDKRRRKLAKLMEGYGVRVQWSVFECVLRQEEITMLRKRLSRLIRADLDSVRMWPVPQASCARIVQIGKAVDSTDWEDPVI